MSTQRPISWLPIMGILVLVVGVLGWLLLVFAGNPAGVIHLPGAQGSKVDYFTDKGGRLPLEAPELRPSSDWRRWSGEGYLLSKRGDVLWVRVTLRNQGDRVIRGVLDNDDFFADQADAWIVGKDGPVHIVSGEAVPAAEKVLPGREVAWPVTVPARSECVVYLRVANFFGAYARPVWWPEATDFHVARMRGSLAEGLYMGGLLALLGYNTLLWLRMRATDIGWYALYLGSMAAFMLLARAQLPGLGWALGSPWLETALTLVVVLSGFFLTQFARVFLELKTGFPRTDRWMRGWSVVLLGIVVLPLATPWGRWLSLAVQTITVTHVGLLVVALVAWRTGVRQARYFLLSFGCLFAGSLPMVAVWFWNDLFRDAAMRGLMIGSALEMLLLSLAVADRFAQAQKKLVEETEQRRMIEEAYADELEIEVRERTRELQAANADKDRMLAVIGHDLRGPLTGLMRSADGSTGDFARDAARTGRALLLMIEDLVLWARLRAGTRVVSMHQAHALVMPAVALHHSLAERDGVELALEVPEDLRVETDLVLSQTLVRNLLANALKFARARVVLRAEDDGEGGVRLTVGNDGAVLPAAVAARLAAGEDEPMTATGGMGLRLCREICLALDTKLEARSGTGGGAEIGFTLKKPAATTERNS
ncbi:MAG: sensor histidine kinase [Opitutaceae bacterium]|jgi:signal transduction histidine kinase